MQRITVTMRRVTVLGMAMLVVSAIVGAGAVSVSASGHEFAASTIGKVTSTALNTQIFKTKAGTVECKHASGAGEVTELKSVTNKQILTYSSCTGFGTTIKISAAHFEFNANGGARLEKKVVLTPEGSAGCEVILEPQTFESLGYENNVGGTVTAGANVSKIHSHGTGGVCGSEENTEGTYTGSIKAELEGGTLTWK